MGAPNRMACLSRATRLFVDMTRDLWCRPRSIAEAILRVSNLKHCGEMPPRKGDGGEVGTRCGAQPSFSGGKACRIMLSLPEGS